MERSYLEKLVIKYQDEEQIKLKDIDLSIDVLPDDYYELTTFINGNGRLDSLGDRQGYCFNSNKKFAF